MLGKHNDLGAFDERTGEPRVKVANFQELGSVNGIQDFIKNLKPDPKFLYLHVIAMGAGEYYGCNKNGDYFPENSLLMYHHTFEQNAKVFKEHNNKPDSPSYGTVPKSWYNRDMHRVELILAIERVKAPDIVKKVESGETLEVSMGCRVPHDVCSICGNKSSKKSEYCQHIKYELKMVYSDGKQVFMNNLQPTFFDISVVARRADKIAYMLSKVASHTLTLDHIFDIVDTKLAALTKQVPADGVVSKLNTGMYNILPELESIEPDLPAPMLDSMALRHSITDILESFLQNLVPMKPKEFARVVVVNGGYPMHWYDKILEGILSAPRHEEYRDGNYQSDIGELLSKFLPHRSSYGPHVQKRVIILRHGLPKMASDGYDNHYAQMMSERPKHYGTIPVMYDPGEYHRRQVELANRPQLRQPLNPFTVGMLLGAVYAASRGAQGLSSLAAKLNSNSTVAKVGLGALLATGTLASFQPHRNEADNYRSVKMASEKIAYKMGWGTKNVILPFVGAHLASAHYRRKFYQGQELNSIEKFVAENPDYLSVAAPFAAHFASKGLPNSIKSIGKDLAQPIAKTASEILGEHSYSVEPSLEIELYKISAFGDVLADSLVQGIIFHGRGTSGIGAVSDMMIDNTVFRKAGEMAQEHSKNREKRDYKALNANNNIRRGLTPDGKMPTNMTY